jgi:hypothetical protein
MVVTDDLDWSKTFGSIVIVLIVVFYNAKVIQHYELGLKQKLFFD